MTIIKSKLIRQLKVKEILILRFHKISYSITEMLDKSKFKVEVVICHLIRSN